VSNRVRKISIGGISPHVVRVGTDKGINISVKDISLDYLVDLKLDGSQSSTLSKNADNEMDIVMREIESTKTEKQARQTELMEVRDNTARTLFLEEEIKKLNSRRMTLTQQFDRLKDKKKSESRTLDATRRKFRDGVLQDADIICSTLSGAGHELLENVDFDIVVIDEAAQGWPVAYRCPSILTFLVAAIELSSLIPLKYRCRSCIMVGGLLHFSLP
jgi:senataxin